MKVKSAIKVLDKECEFLGKTFDELIEDINKNKDTYPLKSIEAYNVFTEVLRNHWKDFSLHASPQHVKRNQEFEASSGQLIDYWRNYGWRPVNRFAKERV